MDGIDIVNSQRWSQAICSVEVFGNGRVGWILSYVCGAAGVNGDRGVGEPAYRHWCPSLRCSLEQDRIASVACRYCLMRCKVFAALALGLNENEDANVWAGSVKSARAAAKSSGFFKMFLPSVQ